MRLDAAVQGSRKTDDERPEIRQVSFIRIDLFLSSLFTFRSF